MEQFEILVNIRVSGITYLGEVFSELISCPISLGDFGSTFSRQTVADLRSITLCESFRPLFWASMAFSLLLDSPGNVEEALEAIS